MKKQKLAAGVFLLTMPVCSSHAQSVGVDLSAGTVINTYPAPPGELFNPYGPTGNPGVWITGPVQGEQGTVSQIFAVSGSLSEQSSITATPGQNCQDYGDCIYSGISFIVNATADVSGSLASASIRALATTANTLPFAAPYPQNQEEAAISTEVVNTSARISDVITFHVPSDMQNQTVLGTATLTVIGTTFEPIGDAPIGVAGVTLGGTSAYEALAPTAPYGPFPLSVTTVIHSPGDGDLSLPIDAVFYLGGNMNLNAFGLGYGSTVDVTDGISADYNDTGFVTFDLPAGVTYTSASGVFLTQPLVEAPEPASLVLLLSGVLGLNILRRHRQSNAVLSD